MGAWTDAYTEEESGSLITLDEEHEPDDERATEGGDIRLAAEAEEQSGTNEATDSRPLAGGTFWETSPYRVEGDDAAATDDELSTDPTKSGGNPTESTTTATTSTDAGLASGGDQPVDASDATPSDPFNVDVDVPEIDVPEAPAASDVLPDLGTKEKAVLALVALVVLAVVFRPYASGAATAAQGAQSAAGRVT